MISPEEVQKLADLSRLKLSPEEKATFAKEIDSILGYVSQISDLKSETSNQKTPEIRNVFRKDEEPHESGIYTEVLLAQAPKRDKDYLKVKKILQND
jgi:aspartyl-tRNA(Asn)/glutamyl-tRNA(Gln) amidotransferase subunit C